MEEWEREGRSQPGGRDDLRGDGWDQSGAAINRAEKWEKSSDSDNRKERARNPPLG